MLDHLISRIRALIAPATPSDQCAESLYTLAEHDRSDREAGQEQPARAFQGRLVGRAFGLVWLIYLVGAFPALIREDLGPALAIPAWITLLLFTAGYVVITLFGTPLWATDNPRIQDVNRTIIGGQIASLLALIVLLPSWNFGYVFIYCAVSAGIFLVRRDAIRVIALCTVLSLLAGVYEHTSFSDIFTAGLLVGGIGVNTLFWSALMAQNRALRRARAEITRLAISEERLRIARDLHDLLGHNLSIITLKSELAGRLLASHPDRAAIEIADVQQVSRTALQEVREAVAGYRMLSLTAEIEQSAQLLQAAGVSFAPRVTTGDLPLELDRTLAWFVREGTTNIIRHADATTAGLRIDHLGNRVFAEYTDTGSRTSPERIRSSPALGPSSQGFGLIGLGERMRALGGEFSAGPMPERGFRLYAELPIATAQEPDAPPTETAAPLEFAR